MARQFIDTNLLVYAEDPGEPERGPRAVERVQALMRGGEGIISTQVLQEFFSITTRKLRLPPLQMRERMQTFDAFEIVQVTRERTYEAIDLHLRHGITFWDALIVRTAATARCVELLSEDHQDGQVIDGVRVVNPFR